MAEQSGTGDQTRHAEEGEARAAHVADRAPSAEEERDAERARKDPSLSGDQKEVAERYREMAERGVEEKGEGRID